MSAISRTYADVQGFINLLMVACEDATINSTLQKLLSQPDSARKVAVLKLVERLRASAALPDLVEAITCLLDDDVAEKAFQAIYKCGREPRSRAHPSSRGQPAKSPNNLRPTQ